jgi:hypothetical protein
MMFLPEDENDVNTIVRKVNGPLADFGHIWLTLTAFRKLGSSVRSLIARLEIPTFRTESRPWKIYFDMGLGSQRRARSDHPVAGRERLDAPANAQ